MDLNLNAHTLDPVAYFNPVDIDKTMVNLDGLTVPGRTWYSNHNSDAYVPVPLHLQGPDPFNPSGSSVT